MNTKKVIDTIVKNLKKYFKDNGLEKAIVGVSGGKDSLVTAMLLKEAIGAENVIGVLLPEGSQEDIDDANITTNLLGIKQTAFNILPITANFIEIAFSIMNKDGEMETVNVSEQSKMNLRARIRMATLYYVAQSVEGSCVVGTSNAGKIYVGQTTKHGDSGADVFPLGELYDDEVLEVGNMLNNKYFEDTYEGLKLMSILHKVPSDDGVDDEDAMGVTYDDIKKVATGGTTGDKKKDSAIKKMHVSSEHKRKMPPIIKAGAVRK